MDAKPEMNFEYLYFISPIHSFVYIRYMRNGLTFAFILLSFLALAQKEIKLKKKYLGEYSGVIPAYQIQTNEGLVSVEEAEVSILFKKDFSANLTIGHQQKTSTFRVISKDKKDYTIELVTAGELYVEKINLQGKNKLILRKGIYPQPEATLKKN